MRYLRCLAQAGYRGDIVPISTHLQQVDGYEAVPDLSQSSKKIDVLMIASRNTRVLDELKQGVDAGIRDFVVVSGGFRETGAEGIALEEELTAFAEDAGIRVLGPQALGYFNFIQSIALMPVVPPRLETLPQGRIGLVSQSGAMGVLVTNKGMEKGIRFSYSVATGNQAMIDSLDVAEFLVRDDSTSSVVILLEGAPDAGRLAALAVEAAQRGKPIIVWKAGRSDKAAQVALTHSGSLTGSDTAFEAFCDAYGLIRTRGINELPETAALASSGRKPKGNRVGVVTISGGLSGLVADLGSEANLEFPDPSGKTAESISAVTRLATPANPFDLTGEATRRPELVDTAVSAFVDDPNFDSVVVDLSTYSASVRESMVQALISSAPRTDKLLAVGMWTTEDDLAATHRSRLDHARIPFVDSAEGWITALGSLVRGERARTGLLGRLDLLSEDCTPPTVVATVVDGVAARQETVMDAMESAQTLAEFGFTQPQQQLVTSSSDAVKFAASLSGPVAVKAVAAGLAHKTDIGGVVLNLTTPEQVHDAFQQVISAAQKGAGESSVRGALVQEMISGSAELMLGMVRDPQFGPVVTIASGGVLVEVVDDASHFIPPIDDGQVEEILTAMKVDRILRGTRGGLVLNREAVKAAIIRFANMARALPSTVAAVDLNPLIVTSEEAIVVDSLFVLE